LPPIGSPGYYVLLAFVAIFILGPLGAVSAAFMNFSIGFFIGGQVLAGILGSAVTLPYGPEGKHGANYMQTMAASVAGMSGMVVLIQAMAWMGLPEPEPWKLVLYILSIGMLGVGVGMLYTPIVVDRMKLAFPSGLAVANILRALTDPKLLKRSIAQLGGGAFAGYAGGLISLKIISVRILLDSGKDLALAVGNWGISTSTFGAGMIVGARIAIPALVVGQLGEWLKPMLIRHEWLHEGEEFRKIGFIIALGTILGAAIIDIGLIIVRAVRQFRTQHTTADAPAEDWKRVNVTRLTLWVGFWAVAVVLVGSQVLAQPIGFVAAAVALTFVFVLINGISAGISDSNPISSAFVLTVFILAALGLKDPGVGLMCGAIMLISCSSGGDMQQDRSTGWRLGTNRVIQFRYQVIGIAMGAVLCVVLAKLFMNAYPALRIDQFAQTATDGASRWNSSMTYKFVGALRGITTHQAHVMTALQIGIAIGLATEGLRKILRRWTAGRRVAVVIAQIAVPILVAYLVHLWAIDVAKEHLSGIAVVALSLVAALLAGAGTGWLSWRTKDFFYDAVILPSPYASSFGGFVPLLTTYWWVAGGVAGSLWEVWEKFSKKNAPGPSDLPSDMSTTSLVGGGLIAGESLAALTIGILSLLRTVL
jgi:uncharacterized oligopeptide transporter (OPT) family protein